MFKEQNNLSGQKLEKDEEVEDIFADTDIDTSENNAASKKFPGMRKNGEKKNFDIHSMQQAPSELENDDKYPKSKKRVIVIILFLMVLIVIIFTACYYLFYKTQNNNNNKNNNNINSIDIVNINKPNINRPVDSDSDGLTDEEEEIFGTNPNFADSDEDGLFDKEEIEIYYTDPLNFDTDEDGYSDGQEVKSGHNPNGEGKLKIN